MSVSGCTFGRGAGKQTRLRLHIGDQSERKTRLIVTADGRTGRLFDPVRTGSQQPAALRIRTFNSRLVRGTIPPPI